MTGLLRRSELALPACNDHMFAKGASSGADLVFLDLEELEFQYSREWFRDFIMPVPAHVTPRIRAEAAGACQQQG